MKTTLTVSNYRCFSASQPLVLEFGSGITAFLGVNNSGKSTMLKFVHEFRRLFAIPFSDTSALTNLILGNQASFNESSTQYDPEERFWNGNQENLKIALRVEDGPTAGVTVVAAEFEVIRGTENFLASFFFANGSRVEGQRGLSEVRSDGWFYSNGAKSAKFDLLFVALRKLASAYYISAQRHISAFQPSDNTTFSGQEPRVYVGQPFIEHWDSQQTGYLVRNREKIFALVNKLKDLFDFKQLTIQAAQGRRSLDLFVNNKPYRLGNLGSGLEQFILVLGNAAFIEPSYILIDEPEISLHPVLQLKFLTTLAEYAKDGLFFATHNVGLARETADHIFTVKQTDNGSIVRPFNGTPRLAEFLGELNYSNFRLLGFNQVLLVEGRTDIKTYIQFLRMFDKDRKTLVLSLGGSDFINGNSRDELQEFKQAAQNVFIVIDSEKSAADQALEGPRQEFAEVCADLQIPCHVLERRATENYLTEAAIQEEKSNAYRALTAYQRRNELNPVWAKHENWRIAKRMNRADLQDTDLGEFINRL